MDDHTNESDSPHIQIEPESPPHPSRRLTSSPRSGLWSNFLSTTGSWTTNGNDRPYLSLGTEEDGAHSPHSPGVFTPQSPGTLSPIVEMLGGFSLGEPFSGTTQRVSYDEQEYRHHGSLLYASNSHHPPTPSLERTRFFHVQHPFYTTSPHSQDSLYSDEASGQMSPIGDNSLPFLTDGGYGTNGTGLGICSVGSLLDQWNFRNSTPSSPFASPPIETPSPLHSNLSPLLSSPFNSPLNIMPHGSLSPLAISNGTVSSKYTGGYIPNHTLSTDVLIEQYMGTESAGPSHSMSTTHDTSPNLCNFLLPSTSHVSGYSHATLRSAPPSPSSPSVHRDHGLNEPGNRRHSHSSGSDHLFQRTAPFDPEVAKFRKETQANVDRKNLSPLFTDSSYSQPIAISYINEGPGPRTDNLNSLIIKDIIASAATLEASKKRRKKKALFICHICSQTLTSKDNLISHTDAHQGLKRFVCNYCDRRFRTRSVLARHQKSKICPASKLPQSKRKERSSFVCP